VGTCFFEPRDCEDSLLCLTTCDELARTQKARTKKRDQKHFFLKCETDGERSKWLSDVLLFFKTNLLYKIERTNELAGGP
jgi:hypothetical protein